MIGREQEVRDTIARLRMTVLYEFDFEPGETALHPRILAALADLEKAERELMIGHLEGAERRVAEATRRVEWGR